MRWLLVPLAIFLLPSIIVAVGWAMAGAWLLDRALRHRKPSA